VVGDIAKERYADVHIAAFLSACAGGRMSVKETIDLTQAMVDSGECLEWDREIVADKHCVGGLPGNRTSPIVVAIAAAAGLLLPKTSSRAITSPAGTADTMETLTRVALSATELRRVVDRVGASLAWGGALSLSPADDVLIRVERALDVDSDAQLAASILSKKIAAGSTHVLIDVPVGPTAKVRSLQDLERLRMLLERVARSFGVRVTIVRTDGSQPVGRGIGPALEARDVLAVLQRSPAAPFDLRERSLLLAATLL
ncbi:thymidine phosphorylase, partial [Ralstonia pseudosolanacearum]